MGPGEDREALQRPKSLFNPYLILGFGQACMLSVLIEGGFF